MTQWLLTITCFLPVLKMLKRKLRAETLTISQPVLEYDDVHNKQREVPYEQLNKVLEGDNLKASIVDIIEKTVESIS